MRVAVLGAGVSGLTSLRACVQHGFEVVCFEKSQDIGGLWRYKQDDIQGEASVMRSTVINTSKEMMSFSDFPAPDTYPNFMHNSLVYKYLQLYAQNFHLLKYIKFQTEVLSVDRCVDYAESGKWTVTYRDVSNNEATETYDAVFLCTGHHVYPHWAEFEGLKTKFKGEVLHSHSYKDQDRFKNKTVVVVGIGNSGGDIAVELSRVAKQVYLVTRSGSWVWNRVADQGYPLDCLYNTRFIQYMKDNFTSPIQSFVQYKLNQRFNHEEYGLQPQHGVFQAHLTINDDLPNRILCGTVIIKPQIQSFKEACFVDGSVVDNVDSVILSTGYSFGFPYVENNTLIPVKENDVSLYKYMYPTNLTHPTLCVIGLIQPWGAIMPISEMQARVACALLDGTKALPQQQYMIQDIRMKKDVMAKQYRNCRRHTIQVDYIPYMDELATWLGVKPDMLGLLKSDPRLAMSLVFGPCTPYQFRLEGRHKWEGSRNACMTVWDRVRKPLQTRLCQTKAKHVSKSMVILIIIAIVFVWFMFIV